MTGEDSRHERPAAILLIVLLFVVGCRQDKTPQAKQARLIAVENMQLKERLADIEARHANEFGRCQEELAVCRRRIETLERDLQKGIAARVNSVTMAVMNENARLRQEIEQLRAEVRAAGSAASLHALVPTNAASAAEKGCE